MPDDIVIRGGRVEFIELKQDKGRLSKLQVYHLDRLTAAGQRCFVLYGKKDVVSYLLGVAVPWQIS